MTLTYFSAQVSVKDQHGPLVYLALSSSCILFQDLGCGWGSLSLYICEKYPKCKVTCVSNSNTQRQLIQEKALNLGYQGRLDSITADANIFTTAKRFDRIFSIEMFEVKYFI